MKATDLLVSQHDEVKKMFASLERAKERREKKTILTKIAKNLTAHMVIEQEIFYPACAKRFSDSDTDMVAEAFEEHGVAVLQLSRALDSRGADVTFDAKAKVLRELIEHHIEEEQNELFKKVRKAFDAEELEDLGEQMEARFESQLADGYKEVLAEPPPDAGDALVAAHRRSQKRSGTQRAAARKKSTRRAKR